MVVTDAKLAQEGHRYIHNTFITLIAELGVLGLGFSVVLIVIIVNAARGWSNNLRPLFIVLVFTPLLIHEGHSVRMLLIVIALGLSQHLSREAIPRVP